MNLFPVSHITLSESVLTSVLIATWFNPRFPSSALVMAFVVWALRKEAAPKSVNKLLACAMVRGGAAPNRRATKGISLVRIETA